MPSAKYKDKTDEDIEALKDYVIEERIKDGIKEGIGKWWRTICITATSAVLGFFGWMGNFIYEKWGPLKAAARAFFEAAKQ